MVQAPQNGGGPQEERLLWACVQAARAMNAHVAPLAAVRPVAGPRLLADSTHKGVALDARGRPAAFVVCSSPGGPDAVARSVERAALARAALGDSVGSAVVEPIAHGALDGLSYAVYPYCRPMPGNRALWLLRRSRVRARALDWILDAMRTTGAGAPAASQYDRVLKALAEFPGLPADVQHGVAAARSRLRSGQWTPRHVLDHNDFWLGNLLWVPPMTRSTTPRYPFLIIDWGSANVSGYGVYDLIRLGRSLGMSRPALARATRRCASALGCASQDLRGHLLAGLGHLSQHLGCVPPGVFVGIVVSCWQKLNLALANEPVDEPVRHQAAAS